MKEPICKHCGEYEKCVCFFDTCRKCGKTYSNFDSDESHQIFEYRGALACGKCFEKVIKDRDNERQEVMEELNATVRSQAGGEWMNGGYKTMKTTPWGSPQPKVIKEPLRVQEYEGRI